MIKTLLSLAVLVVLLFKSTSAKALCHSAHRDRYAPEAYIKKEIYHEVDEIKAKLKERHINLNVSKKCEILSVLDRCHGFQTTKEKKLDYIRQSKVPVA